AEYEPGTCHSLIRAEAWSGAGGYASAEAEDELGVVGHLLRSPRWVERQLQLDVLDPLDLPRGAVDVLRDERAGRAAHGRQAVDDLGRRVLHLDLVEQPQVDDVHPELGILDLPEHLEHFLARRHPASVEARSVRARTMARCSAASARTA